ncbi:MAG TPA: serine/threonine-protein kinase [Steroidobacteraceae bacterium]|nr:serine/threonine-protein kinase [Steroidobacteraceae bacterium]
MTPERWLQIKELFYVALDLPRVEQAALLDRECAGDAALRTDLQSLLDAHHQPGPFLDQPATASALGADAPGTQWIGRRIGPYELVELIGAGGMGEVYKAVRADDQFRQQVAIKLVRGGYDTQQVLARFKGERQILATLVHPNIARLLDGGATEGGLPYLVMELIEGERIDQYCERLRLSVRSRVSLFRDVCAAVSYAHQQLVIHCDLKPGNILVTADGTVKLLDFGVAKLLSLAPRMEGEERTVTLMRALTPEFASPEQVRGEATSTASDVYSLGVVLYRLLTGRSPYRSTGTLPHEIIRDVCDTEPDRPSVAKQTSVELRGDLDNITLKALRKEPARRYASVEQFSEDLRRYLEGLPILARGDQFAYRAGKFILRNKIAVAAGVLLFLSLLGGLTATLWQARIARAETARAERHFASVRKLANSFMFELHDAIAELPGSTAARQLLVRNALQYLDELSSESAGDARLHEELATAYVKIGDIQGEFGRQNLGDVGAALQSYGKAVALLERLSGADPANTDVMAELSRAYRKLGTASYIHGDPAAASIATEKATALAQTLVEKKAGDAAALSALAAAHGDRCKILTFVGDARASADTCVKAINTQEAVVRLLPSDRAARRTLSVMYDREASRIGIAAVSDADRQRALDLHRKALEVAMQLAAADVNDAVAQAMVGVDHNGVGEALMELHDVPAAVEEYTRAQQVFDAMIARDPQNVEIRYDNAQVMNNLANALRIEGKNAEALSILRSAMALAESLPGRESNAFYQAGEATIGVRLAHAYAAVGDWPNAQARYEKSRASYLVLKQRGVLQTEDVAYLDEAIAGLARCKLELAKSAARGST